MNQKILILVEKNWRRHSTIMVKINRSLLKQAESFTWWLKVATSIFLKENLETPIELTAVDKYSYKLNEPENIDISRKKSSEDTP